MGAVRRELAIEQLVKVRAMIAGNIGPSDVSELLIGRSFHSVDIGLEALLPGQFPAALGVCDVSDVTLAVLRDMRTATLT